MIFQSFTALGSDAIHSHAYLKGESSPLLEGASADYPEVTISTEPDDIAAAGKVQR